MPECSNMQWFQLHESKPFKSETIWVGFLSYEPIRVLTNSVSLFWRRESKLLRMACKALRTQHSCSTPQCLWGSYPVHPILVPPWMPLSRMHFRLVCLENSFSFPQILPSSNYFSVCLFVFSFFRLPQRDHFLPYAMSSIWCISVVLPLLVCHGHLFICFP